MVEVKAGLQDVVIATSDICSIDGQRGNLLYRGYNIHDLAEHSTFEEVVYLLWHGRLPKRAELDELKDQLAEHRALSPEIIELLRRLPPAQHPMETLRTAVSALSLFDPEAEDMSPDANRRKAMRLTAQMGTLVGTFGRVRSGQDAIAPDPTLCHAANFLYMVNGEAPSEYVAKVLDLALILHADHGFNASTFTARVVISSMSDMYSAIAAAVGSLKGPLHGGANSEVMSTLQEIGSLDRVEEYVMSRLATKQKVMGFGHRVYHTYDPRARLLSQYSQKLAQQTGNTKWYEMSKKIEQIMEREVAGKGIYPNVDFYSATVYYYMGLDQDLFTPIFAVSRISGWTAHVIEQLQNNRLFRPRAIYPGPKNVPYVPINDR